MNSFEVLVSILLIALASARLTRLLVSDSITEPIRDKFVDHIDGEYYVKDEFFAKLIHCSWCSGLWITTLVGLLYLLTDFMLIPCIILSASYIQGFINSKEE